ncbi:MAG: GTP cyclohydrolase I FolE [Acidimicrobiia bacterium]|nr:GTP cyclohydrolase I FolE [Acidimicrobiia bacterium]
MTRLLISLGSNINPTYFLERAAFQLRLLDGVKSVRFSRVLRSPPVGTRGPEFLNAAALVEYEGEVSAADLALPLTGIEARLGRVRTEDKNAARTIDLDLVMIEGHEPQGTDLVTYAFVSAPCAELAPEWTIPGDGRTIKEISMDHDHSGLTTEDLELNEDEIFDPEYEELVRKMLAHLGEDPDRQGLEKTPLRVAKAMRYLTRGYHQDVKEVINQAMFESDAEDMVLLRNIEFYSMCEHHLLPFYGKAHVAYIPDGHVIGLSKLARITDVFSRRLQIQERLTNQIADSLMESLEPKGVAVAMEGVHLCMLMRGVEKQTSSMVTSAVRGSFRTDARTRAEFMGFIYHE